MDLLGLLFITVSVFAGVAKGYCGKRIGTYAETITDSAKLNVLRMILCSVITVAVIAFQGNIENIFNASPLTLIVSALCAFSMSVFIIAWLMAVRGTAYMLVNVFLNLGVIIPITLGTILFGEEVGVKQIIGILILLVAIWLMLGYNKQLNAKFTFKNFLVLAVCGIFNGLSDFFLGSTSKISNTFGGEKLGVIDTTVFSFFLYLFSFILLLGYTTTANFAKHKAKIKINKKIVITMTLMAAFLFINTYFKSLAGARLTSFELFSTNTGFSLVFASIMAAFMLKEHPNLKSVIGIVLTFVALFFLKG